MDSKDCAHGELSPEDLRQVFQFSRQHRNLIVLEMHHLLPELWGKPQEVGETAFYEKLIASFSINSDRTLQALDAISKKKKSPQWRTIVSLPIRAWMIGRKQLRLLDLARWLEIDADLDNGLLRDPGRTMSDALDERGHPEFKRVIEWLEIFYPNLIPSATNQDCLDDVSDDGATMAEVPRQEWCEGIARARDSLKQAAAKPFQLAPVESALAALNELVALATRQDEILNRKFEELTTKVQGLCARIRSGGLAEGGGINGPLESLDQWSTSVPRDIPSDAVYALLIRMESEVGTAEAASTRRDAVKLAAQDALAEDDSDRVIALLQEQKQEKAAIDRAISSIGDLLRELLGIASAERVSPGSDASESSSDEVAVDQDPAGGEAGTEERQECVDNPSDEHPNPTQSLAEEGSCKSVGTDTQTPAESVEQAVIDQDKETLSAQSPSDIVDQQSGLSSLTDSIDSSDEIACGQSTSVGPAIDETAQNAETPSKPVAQEDLPQVTATPPAPPERLSGDCFTYEAFRERRWIAPDGTCRDAPWSQPDFDQRLLTESARAIQDLRLTHLEIFSRALESRSQRPLVAAEDVRALSQIWAHPESDSSGYSDHARLPRILEAANQHYSRDYVLLATLLELIKPSDETPPSGEDRQSIMGGMSISNPDLRLLIERLLTFRQHGEDGWRFMRGASRDGPMLTDMQIIEQLRGTRLAFQNRAAQLWSAAGGRIQTTHCRTAWTEFMDEWVHPLLSILTPSSKGDDFRSWDLVRLSAQIRKLRARHDRIADRAGAKYSDRRVMDKSANEIADLALAVVYAAQLQTDRSNAGSLHGLELPVRELRRLVDGESLPCPAEELCRRTLAVIEHRAPIVGAGSITFQDQWSFPDLLPLLSYGSDGAFRSKPSTPLADIPPESIVQAAAILLHGNTAPPMPEDMPRALKTRLLEADRPDLLPYVVGSDEFDAAEKTRIHREESARLEALNQRLRTLEGLQRDAHALSLPSAAQINDACDQLRRLLSNPDRSHRELLLIGSWVESLVDALEKERLCNVDQLRVEASRIRDDDHRAAVLAELESSRFERALAALRNADALKPEPPTSTRAVVWRQVARSVFGDAAAFLHTRSQSGDAGELPMIWLKQRRPADAKAFGLQLRRAFYDFVSGEGELSPQRRRRVVPKELREFRASQVAINCGELLKLLQQEGLNPTFVPQLREFSELLIMNPPLGVTPTNAPNELSKSIAAEHGGRKLVVFLWPGLQEPARERILTELRGRNLPSGAGAVLDDLDLCRLIGEDQDHRPHGILGLVEVALEQVLWRDLSPYVSRDGQFIQMEMFVGRDREARKLAHTAEYSRIFSGRKLGKSALLKYVEETYSGTRLPSGKHLRVIYIVAGGESENWLTDRIIDRIRLLFSNVPESPAEQDPGDRLAQFLDAFFKLNQDISLLIILDEADSFVEGQLRQYDQVRERCLSFRMMKDYVQEVDQNNLPRVRFVFSGYRITNSRGGAWANAGSVLRLKPLNEEEAVKLVEGPLSRLGIDVREQAPTIARYCGFQPAIIIRFCDSLLKHLQATRPASARREVLVTYDDVVSTFNQASVQEEIRTINDNNFQGNRVGRIIFWTMLLAFNDLLSGQGLQNAPEELLKRIRQIDSDTTWLRRLDPSETGEIQRNLHDFRDRELIDEEQGASSPIYRMKFPAHLSVLMTEEDPEHQIRQDIRRVRETDQELDFMSSLLTPKQIDDLYFALSDEGRDLGIKVAVAASPWVSALQDDRAGVVDRLGYRASDVTEAANLVDGADFVRESLIVHSATVSVAEQAIVHRSSGSRSALLIGGLDLMRWAISQQSLVGGEAMVSYVGLQRFDYARISWWYERLRNIHFDTRDATKRLFELTSGVPILLSILDRMMPQCEEVSAGQFDELCTRFQAALPEIARNLVSGDPATSLSPREGELLRMAAIVGSANDGTFNWREELVDNWDLLYREQMPDSAGLYAQDGDEIAIHLLIKTGFIPADGSGTVRFAPKDAIYSLLLG